MLFTTNKMERWKLFDGYARRLVTQNPDFALTREEWKDFQYLKYYFSEDYLMKKLKPWIPSIFDKDFARESTSK